MAIQTHRQWQRVLRVSSYLSLITWDGLLFCGGSATWRCDAHTNEPLPVCGRAYGQGSWGGDGETWVRRPESGLLSQPLTMKRMEVGRETEGEGVAHVLHLFLPSFICQRLTWSPQTWKTEVFSLLCHYQEIIICCSVFHEDNQDFAKQLNKLPHGGYGKYTNIFLHETLPWVAVLICFGKRISGIIYLLCQKSRALILIVRR